MAVMKLKTETGEVMIDLEKLGFSATVVPPPEQVALKVQDLLQERDEWRTRAETAQKRETAYKEREEKLAALECELFLQDAVNNFKIAKNQVEFLKDMGKDNLAAVKKYVDGLRSQEYLKREQGLSGSQAGPTDPVAQVFALAAEKMANDKTLSKGEALKAVQRENQELSARYREAQLAGTKGGEN